MTGTEEVLKILVPTSVKQTHLVAAQSLEAMHGQTARNCQRFWATNGLIAPNRPRHLHHPESELAADLRTGRTISEKLDILQKVLPDGTDAKLAVLGRTDDQTKPLIADGQFAKFFR